MHHAKSTHSSCFHSLEQISEPEALALMERKSLAIVFSFLILLFAAQEMVVKTEAKTCEKPSKFFSGGCVGTSGNKECDYLCRRGEGLLSGACKGLKCVCTKAC